MRIRLVSPASGAPFADPASAQRVDRLRIHGNPSRERRAIKRVAVRSCPTDGTDRKAGVDALGCGADGVGGLPPERGVGRLAVSDPRRAADFLLALMDDRQPAS